MTLNYSDRKYKRDIVKRGIVTGTKEHMLDVTKIDDAIKYLDFEPKKKSGGDYQWLVALLLSPYILGLIVLAVGAVLQSKR